MSPFLPPHRQYDFGRAQSPPLHYNEELEDTACCSLLLPPQSPIPFFHDTEDCNEQKNWGEDTSCLPMQAEYKEGPTKKDQADNNENQPHSHSHTLRKRATVEVGKNIISNVKRQHKQDSLPAIHTSKNPINTITLDRFSACIPCRRRKIKCIPRGDSHHYLSNGTNNGVCATCIRRKKDCFWPKIDLTTRASPSSPCQQEAAPSSAVNEVEKIQGCEEKDEREECQDAHFQEIREEVKEAISSSSIIKKEEDEPMSLDIQLAVPFDESCFGVPGQGFGRVVCTPGLSSSSSSLSSFSTSSSPVSPRTDASFLSPTTSESFFFDGKAACQSPRSTYLDTLHQALQSEVLFADGYYSN